MPLLYLAHRNGSSSSHTEAEVKALIAADEVAPNQLVWRPGMAEWLPVVQVFPEAYPQEEPKRQKANPGPRFKLRYSLETPLACIKWVSYAFATMVIANMWLSVMELLPMPEFLARTEFPRFLSDTEIWVGLFSGLLATAYVLLFMNWQHRISKNVVPIRSEGLRITRQSAKLGLPFFTIFASYWIHQELWKFGSNPYAWAEQKPNPSLRRAWQFAGLSLLFWLAPIASETWATYFDASPWLNLAEGVVELCALPLLYRVMSDIAKLQKAMVGERILKFQP